MISPDATPRRRAALASLLLLAAAPVLAGEPASPEAVVAAERAFAAETLAKGFKKGFLAHVAADGILFQPGPVLARPLLERAPDAPPPGPPLNWWPLWAGIAASGDLGFTTGGANIPVRYFTVWKKQPDGSWKWIYDGGPRLAALLPGSAESVVAYLAPATAAAGSAERALTEIAPLEADLAATAAADAAAAHLKYLAEDGLVAGSTEPTTIGRASQQAELGRRPRQARLKALGGAASQAGDMAFTYGEARWTEPGRPEWGHYARIWQKRREGWKLVADILVPVPLAVARAVAANSQ